MKAILFLVFPVLAFSEISPDLLRECSNANYQACLRVGEIRMNQYSPDYDPSLAFQYLQSACNANIASGCFKLHTYYDMKSDKERSRYYLKRSCDLGNSSACFLYNKFRGD